MTPTKLYGIVRNGKAIGVSEEEYRAYIAEIEQRVRLKDSVAK